MKRDSSCAAWTFVLPHSRPMPLIGPQCHELRITDKTLTWRIIYHVAGDAVVILDVFNKKTAATPVEVIARCRGRLATYLAVVSVQERNRP